MNKQNCYIYIYIQESLKFGVTFFKIWRINCDVGCMVGMVLLVLVLFMCAFIVCVVQRFICLDAAC